MVSLRIFRLSVAICALVWPRRIGESTTRSDGASIRPSSATLNQWWNRSRFQTSRASRSNRAIPTANGKQFFPRKVASNPPSSSKCKPIG